MRGITEKLCISNIYTLYWNGPVDQWHIFQIKSNHAGRDSDPGTMDWQGRGRRGGWRDASVHGVLTKFHLRVLLLLL
jgi:hypothetical protein